MKKDLIDGRKATKLTPKQLRFVYEYCTKTLLGSQSATESARKSGYSESVCKKMAWELQDQQKYAVSIDKHLARLESLGQRAEEEKHFSASINAEQLRGKVGGLYDPTIRLESAIENLPREQLIKKLSELQKKDIPIIGEENIIEVEKEKNKIKLLKE